MALSPHGPSAAWGRAYALRSSARGGVFPGACSVCLPDQGWRHGFDNMLARCAGMSAPEQADVTKRVNDFAARAVWYAWATARSSSKHRLQSCVEVCNSLELSVVFKKIRSLEHPCSHHPTFLAALPSQA